MCLELFLLPVSNNIVHKGQVPGRKDPTKGLGDVLGKKKP
jgi:hypothetical protein